MATPPALQPSVDAAIKYMQNPSAQTSPAVKRFAILLQQQVVSAISQGKDPALLTQIKGELAAPAVALFWDKIAQKGLKVQLLSNNFVPDQSVPESKTGIFWPSYASWMGPTNELTNGSEILKQVASLKTGGDFFSQIKPIYNSAANDFLAWYNQGNNSQTYSSNQTLIVAATNVLNQGVTGGTEATGQAGSGLLGINGITGIGGGIGNYKASTSYAWNLGVPASVALITIGGKTYNLNAITLADNINANELIKGIYLAAGSGGNSALKYLQSTYPSLVPKVSANASDTTKQNDLYKSMHNLLDTYITTQYNSSQNYQVIGSGSNAIITMTPMAGGRNNGHGSIPGTIDFATTTVGNAVKVVTGAPPLPGFKHNPLSQLEIGKITTTMAAAISAYQGLEAEVMDTWEGSTLTGAPAAVLNDFFLALQKQVTSNVTYSKADMIQMLKTYQDPKHPGINVYDTMFPGLQQANKDNQTNLTEAQYQANWHTVSALAGAYGIPNAVFNKSTYGDLVKLNVNVNQIQDRLVKGYEGVMSMGPVAIQAFQNFFGIKPGDLAAYFLDPEKTKPYLHAVAQQHQQEAKTGKTQALGYNPPGTAEILRQSTAAQLAAYAQQVGLGSLAQDKAMALQLADQAKSSAINMTPGAVYDSIAQEKAGILASAKDANLYQKTINGGIGTTVSQDTALAAQIPGLKPSPGETTVQAQREVQYAEQARLAPFQKGGGFEATTKGVTGLGYAKE